MNIILLGAPGAGKGTHAQRLTKDFNIPHVSTGDILRENIKNGADLGGKAKSYMDQGKLVPDDLIIEIMIERINENDCAKGFILDGFPRTAKQAEALDLLLQKLNKKIDIVLDIEVELDIILDRMSGRLTCKNCGAVYHTRNLKPKVAGVCDICGKSELITREDDDLETVKNRYLIYQEQTMPLIDYYEKQKKLVKLDGFTGGGDVVYKKILNILSDI